jgi:hypothetical protein
LERARDWVVHLDGDAPLEVRLATLTHDIERMFPSGPVFDKAHGRWDDPDYLYAHASRSAEVVGVWIHEQADVTAELDRRELRRLITLHEFGGLAGADLVQAGDSLSFLETLQDVVRSWVEGGECDVAQARAKHQYMADRIRIAEARRLAEPLLEAALASLDDIGASLEGSGPPAVAEASREGGTPPAVAEASREGGTPPAVAARSGDGR